MLRRVVEFFSPLHNKPNIVAVNIMNFHQQNLNRLPMEDLDCRINDDFIPEDERLMNAEVICGEADLFYLDCYLQELFRDRGEC